MSLTFRVRLAVKLCCGILRGSHLVATHVQPGGRKDLLGQGIGLNIPQLLFWSEISMRYFCKGSRRVKSHLNGIMALKMYSFIDYQLSILISGITCRNKLTFRRLLFSVSDFRQDSREWRLLPSFQIGFPVRTKKWILLYLHCNYGINIIYYFQ